MFNWFKCRHKRTYEVTTKMDDGSFAVNTYCRKCEATVKVDIEPPIVVDLHTCEKNKKAIMHLQPMNTEYSVISYECSVCGSRWQSKRYPSGDECTPELERLRHQGMLLQYNHIVDINEKVRR